VGGEPAGKGIDPLRAGDKSWSARDGSTFSMRTGSTAFFLLIARSTSRATKSDSLLALDRTRRKAEEVSMPLMISSP
jgi:hypothetical protein